MAFFPNPAPQPRGESAHYDVCVTAGRGRALTPSVLRIPLSTGPSVYETLPPRTEVSTREAVIPTRQELKEHVRLVKEQVTGAEKSEPKSGSLCTIP